MTDERELPRIQYFFLGIDKLDVETYTFALSRMLDGITFPAPVRTTIDLYCGNGTMTAAAYGFFPRAQIHAVDVHDGILAQYLQKVKRITFHQGWVSDVLLANTLPPADFVSISFASRHYGLNESHASSLKRIVQGYLLTVGDNGGLETDTWFRDTFSYVKGNRDDLSVVWKAK